MKELSIEQKANAYDEAVENMRKFRNALNNHEETDLWVSKKDIVTDIEYYFPELKESRDEKIRKLLIRLFKSNTNEKFDDVSTQDIIAWLEKQGNADNIEPKIEPKFHKGEWVVWQDKFYKVNYNGCGYELIDQNGLSTSLEYGTIDENAHLWTISDAKAGDVLAFDNIIVMFKDLYKKFAFHSYGYIEYEEFCISKDNISNCWEGKGFHPATKAQRDTLERAIANAGYRWDAEKKELKKLGQQEVTKTSDQEKDFIEIPFGAKDSEFIGDTYFIPEGCYAVIVDDMVVIKKGERKPAWNEEDDYNLQCMIAKAVNDIQNGNVGRNQELIDWLKSLKDKVQPQPQPKQEWSGEDECYMSECISAIATKDKWSFEEKRKTKLWLFSLKQRIGG